MLGPYGPTSLQCEGPSGCLYLYIILSTVGCTLPGVVVNRVSRVPSVMGTAAARKIDVSFFYYLLVEVCAA